MAEIEPDGARWRLSDLLGPAADRAAREIEAKARKCFRNSWGKNPAKREREDDFVQDVLRVAVATAHRIQQGAVEEPENLDAWLNRVTMNTVHKEFRDDRWKEILREHPEMTEIEDLAPIDPIRLVANREFVHKYFSRLDRNCQELLSRRFWLEDPREVLAQWKQITSNAVGVRIHRCLKRLRKIVEDAGLSGPTLRGAH